MFGSLISGAVKAVGGLLGGEDKTQAVPVPVDRGPSTEGLMRPLGGASAALSREESSRNTNTKKAETADPLVALGAMGSDPWAMARQWLETLRDEDEKGT